MEKVTIKAYAVKHKLSIFNVMKMVKSGKLKTIEETEHGKEVSYIILEPEVEKEVKASIVPLTERESATIHKELRELRAELRELKKEIDSLKQLSI